VKLTSLDTIYALQVKEEAKLTASRNSLPENKEK